MRYKLHRFIDRYIGIPLVVIFAIYKKLIRALRLAQTATSAPSVGDFHILIIKLTMLGDTVLLEPSVRALRMRYPSSKIFFLCSPVNEAVVRNWDFIDEVIVFDFKIFATRPWRILSFVKKYLLRTHRFEVAVDYEQWFRITPILAFLSGSRITAGFKTAGQARDFLFDKKILHTRDSHEIKSFAELTSAVFGFEINDTALQLDIPLSSRRKSQEILEKSGIQPGEKYAVIHPGCGSNGILREWPRQGYASVADYIASRYSLKIVLTGSAEDKDTTRSVSVLMKAPSIDISGRTDFLILADIIRRAVLIVCGNTGVVHIASAVGTPSVVIHGPTSHLKWGPLSRCSVALKSNLDCYPCLYLGYEYRCHLKRCLESVTPQMVMDAVDRTFECLKTASLPTVKGALNI